MKAASSTKEDVQPAAVTAAIGIFVDAVVAPTQDAAEGLPRLAALVNAWLV
jgi:hypothetical protein